MSSALKNNALKIVRRLRDHGFKAYFVGGAVRDMVMNIKPADYDIATDASPEDITKLFRRVIPVGEKFGVSLVVLGGKSFEVSRFRLDGVYEDGRRPKSVEPADEKEDVNRRDFTINAMLLDPIGDRLFDYVGGQEDIARRLIRTVGDAADRFAEDKLRLLRAVRFAVRFDFEIESETMSAIRRLADRVTDVSGERIGDELAKMFSGPHPDRALTLLDETGLLDVVLPEVAAMKGVEQPSGFHPEGDVFEHTRKMLGLFGGGTVTLAFGLLLHDVGKPATFTETDRIRFHRHDEVGADIAEKILRRLRFRRDTVKRVRMLVRNHMRFIHVKDMKRATLKRFLAMDDFDELLELFRLDCLASHASLDLYDFVKGEKEHMEPVLPEPLITGKDLIEMGYEAGPMFKEMLDAAADARLEGEIATREAARDMVRRLFPLSRRQNR